MKTFTITFERQLFPWTDAYKTTRKVKAADEFEAATIAEEIAEENTRIIKVQGQPDSFVGKMTIISIK